MTGANLGLTDALRQNPELGLSPQEVADLRERLRAESMGEIESIARQIRMDFLKLAKLAMHSGDPAEMEAIKNRTVESALADVCPIVNRSIDRAFALGRGHAMGVNLVPNRDSAAAELGVPSSWMAPIYDLLDEIQAKTEDEGLTPAGLQEYLQRAIMRLPEVFSGMDVEAFADVLEAALGGAVVAGARQAASGAKPSKKEEK